MNRPATILVIIRRELQPARHLWPVICTVYLATRSRVVGGQNSVKSRSKSIICLLFFFSNEMTVAAKVAVTRVFLPLLFGTESFRRKLKSALQCQFAVRFHRQKCLFFFRPTGKKRFLQRCSDREKKKLQTEEIRDKS